MNYKQKLIDMSNEIDKMRTPIQNPNDFEEIRKSAYKLEFIFDELTTQLFDDYKEILKKVKAGELDENYLIELGYAFNLEDLDMYDAPIDHYISTADSFIKNIKVFIALINDLSILGIKNFDEFNGVLLYRLKDNLDSLYTVLWEMKREKDNIDKLLEQTIKQD